MILYIFYLNYDYCHTFVNFIDRMVALFTMNTNYFNISLNKLNWLKIYLQSIGYRLLNNWIFLISHFFKLNVIALRINNHYKFNVYLLLFLFICIISSIIIRTNIINEDILLAYFNSIDIKIIMCILTIFAIIYSFKLIFDIIIRGIQGFKIIPEFITLYKSNTINIKSIISLYYLQNIVFTMLSCWILYNIMMKLNIFVDGIYLFILGLGIISSLAFIYKYPLKGFHFDNNIKDYSIWVYFLLFFFFVFYIIILPLIVVNIIQSDQFITFKTSFIDKCINNTNPCLMDGSDEGSTIGHGSEGSTSTIRRNFATENANNRITGAVSNNGPVEVSDNYTTRNVDNTIQIYSNSDTLAVNNHYHVGHLRMTNTSNTPNLPENLLSNIGSNNSRLTHSVSTSTTSINP